MTRDKMTHDEITRDEMTLDEMTGDEITRDEITSDKITRNRNEGIDFVHGKSKKKKFEMQDELGFIINKRVSFDE
jgi:hypothetical protein